MMTPEERTELRGRHWWPGPGWSCNGCGHDWPCTTIRLLDTLDAAEAERDAARAALLKVDRYGKHERCLNRAVCSVSPLDDHCDGCGEAWPCTDVQVIDDDNPVWWRGNDAGVIGVTRRLRKVVDGKDDGAGVIGYAELEQLRRDIMALQARHRAEQKVLAMADLWENGEADDGMLEKAIVRWKEQRAQGES